MAHTCILPIICCEIINRVTNYCIYSHQVFYENKQLLSGVINL